MIGEEGQGELSSAPHQSDKEVRLFRGVLAANCTGDEGLGEFSKSAFPFGEEGGVMEANWNGAEGQGEEFPAGEARQGAFSCSPFPEPHQLDRESFLREVRGVEIETVVAESMCEPGLAHTKSMPLSSHERPSSESSSQFPSLSTAFIVKCLGNRITRLWKLYAVNTKWRKPCSSCI